MEENRRRFQRLAAPVFARPARMRHVAAAQRVVDISLGGLRLYTDDKHRLGDHLELDVVLPDGTLEVVGKIVWIDAVNEPAKYEVGLEFVGVSAEQLEKLRRACC